MLNSKNNNKLYCNECEDYIIVVDGVTAIFYRGYWWCTKHVQITHWKSGQPIVGFPSPGKLIPDTILLQDLEENNNE